MAYDDRKPLMEKIQALRSGRILVAFLNLDRASNPPIPASPMFMTLVSKECREQLEMSAP